MARRRVDEAPRGADQAPVLVGRIAPTHKIGDQADLKVALDRAVMDQTDLDQTDRDQTDRDTTDRDRTDRDTTLRQWPAADRMVIVILVDQVVIAGQGPVGQARGIHSPDGSRS